MEDMKKEVRAILIAIAEMPVEAIPDLKAAVAEISAKYPKKEA